MMGVDSYDGNEYDFTVDQIISSLEENLLDLIRKSNREFLTNEQSINYLNENPTSNSWGNLTRNEYGRHHTIILFYYWPWFSCV